MTDTSLTPSALLAGLPARQGFGDATLIRLAPGSIDLGGGNPATELLPLDLYRDAFRAVTESDGFGALLKYSPAPGLASLRSAIAAREGVDAERVLITNGGAHGLALAVLSTLDPGDVIVVDNPVYPLFLRVLDLIGVEVAPIAVRADGIDTEALEQRLRAGLRPKALFTVPTFQNPSGVTLSFEKEVALVALAEKYGFTIIADDPYRAISFPGFAVPDRAAFRGSDRVLAVNTFSKTLGPGLRLGWIVLPAALSERVTRLRNRIDGQTSGILQAVVERMLGDERLDASISAAGAGYARKAQVLTTALRTEFDGAVEVAEPQGGFFAWARLGGDLDFAQLFETAQDRGVTYQRGEWFAAAGDGFHGHLRLSFSEVSERDLAEGVARLAHAWRGSPHEAERPGARSRLGG
jgi:2-aminoadipate transaminase